MHVIQIVPVGQVDHDLLVGLLPELERRFPGREVRLSVEPLPHPDYAYVPQRMQYRSEPILRALLATQGYAEKVLGVTDLDLFAEGLNFIFGQAQIQGTAAIIALARLHSTPRDQQLFRKRALKEAVHELGHAYGLRHCPDTSCVTHFSNTLADTDRKSDCFCPVDEAQLRAALRT